MPFIYNFEQVEKNGVAVALGNFDGVHIGHKKVLYQTVALAESLNVKPCALVFKQHPPKKGQTAVSGEDIITLEQKGREMASVGIDLVYLYNFSDVCNMTPEAFVKEILVDKMNVKGVCCGFNYRFGHNAAGDVNTLKELCDKYSVKLSVIDRVDIENDTVCSTRIRNAVRAGNIELANKLLGRVFSYDFTVVDGDKRGRTLGAPTINQYFPADFIVPRFGVYAARCFVDGKYHPAVTNIGIRPTIKTETLRSETWIMDYSGDLYGRKVEVGLLKYLRPEKDFNTLGELSAQIAADAVLARKAFERFGGACDE